MMLPSMICWRPAVDVRVSRLLTGLTDGHKHWLRYSLSLLLSEI